MSMSNKNATIRWVGKNKTAMLRKLALVLVLSVQVLSGKGQIYFDGLYGDPAGSGEGISTDGTVRVEDGYLSWSFVGTRKTPFMFQVGMDGNLIASDYLEKEDTVALWARNVIKMNDTLFAGGIWRQVDNEPSAVRGDHGLAVFTLQGDVISERYYGLPDRMEYPARVRRTQDGGFAFVGQVISGTAPNDNGNVHLLKTDSTGNQIWEKEYGGTLDEMGQDVVVTPEGGFLILGWTRSFGEEERDFYLVKTDSAGEQQWQKTFGESSDEGGKSIIQLADGNYLLTGSGSQGTNRSIGRVYKVDGDGDVIWAKTYSYQDNTSNNLHKTIELWNGNLVSAGLTDLTDNGGWIICTDSIGDLLWQREYNKNENIDLFYGLLATADGGFLLSGQAVNEETNSQDAWLLKVDSVGCAYPNCITGVDEVAPTNVMVDVWPNPTSEVLHLELQQQGMAQIMLYDMAGKLLVQKQTSQQREALDVSALENGLYLLTVLQGDMKTTVKVMVW
jgi:hypothetical protein